VVLDVYKDWLGIPEGLRPPDHYQLLRLVLFEDNPEKIRKNYKKLNITVRKYATGKYSNESQQLLNELAKAMLCLTDVEQKREYDVTQGRTIDDRDATTGHRPLTSYLQEQGLLTSDQIREAKSHAERSGLSVRDALVQMKLVEPDVAARALALELGRPFVDLVDMLPDAAVLDKLPRAVVRRHTCLPLFADHGGLLVACSDEPDPELEDEIRLRFNMPIRPVLATPIAINQGIAKYYSAGLRQEAEESVTTEKKTTTRIARPKSVPSDDEKQQRRQLGMLVMCFSFIGFSMLDTFFLYGFYKKLHLPESLPYSGIFIGGPLAVFVYWTQVKEQ